MSLVSVLNICDSIVGPHLHLLRIVCEPESQSHPHITVRYFDKLAIPPEHLLTPVNHVDLLEPGAFGLSSEWAQRKRTVYIRCQSEQLLGLEHKPHFPTSFFHITVYNGESIDFAQRLLTMLLEYPWHFRIRLPRGTTLSRTEIKPSRNRNSEKRRIYSRGLTTLFKKITSESLTELEVRRLTDANRLKLARAITENLHNVCKDFERIPPKQVLTEDSEGIAGLVSDPVDVHLTPPELAFSMAKYAVELLESSVEAIDFGDPAVGNGVFFAALLRVKPEKCIRSAIGVDINKEQVKAASDRWQDRGMDVRLGDYLHMGKLPSRNLILANPPYRRYQDIPRSYKEKLRERASVELGMCVGGQSGLYVYFLLLADAWMAEGAVAAWLIPAEFMQTNYGAAVRFYLTHHVKLIRVHRFDPNTPQFENAQVLSAIVVFEKKVPRESDEVRMTSGGTLEQPMSCRSTALANLRESRRWSVDYDTVHTEETTGLCLGDVFEVRRGIATGANDYFILPRTEAIRLGIPDTCVTPILPKVMKLSSDIVEVGPDGYPAIEEQMCVIDCALTEEEIEERFPSFYQYLSRASSLGVLDRRLVRDRKLWYRQEQRGVARFLCTYMGRGREGMPPIRFIWNKSRAVATNTYIMLYCKPRVEAFLQQNAACEAELFDLLQATARNTMSTEWRMHADGLLKIEPRDLLRVRLAVVPKWLTGLVDNELF